MSREILVERFRKLIGADQLLGDYLMNESGRIFEKLCVPGKETMPDDLVGLGPEYDEANSLWAQISSGQGQAESNSVGHHDYADVVVTTLIATAFVLEDKPNDIDAWNEFETIFGLSPISFLEIWNQ